MRTARRLPRLSEAARQDIRRILTWLETTCRRHAFLDALASARQRLMEFPEIGPRKGASGERQWVAGGEFVIRYRIAADGYVEIARIYGASATPGNTDPFPTPAASPANRPPRR